MSELNCNVGVIEEQLDTHGVYASNTVGASMRPLLRNHQDMVIIYKPEGELKRYDVALYRVGTKYVLHRVLLVKDDFYLIRGDNTFVMEKVPKSAVIGVMTEFNRGGKRHSVNEPFFRFYAWFWHFIYPIRFVWHKVRGFLGRVYRGLFAKK